MDRLKTILAAVDFSPCADAGLAHAIRLAQEHGPGAEVVVLHTVQPLLYNRAWLDADAESLVPTVSQLMDQAVGRMQAVVAACAPSCSVRQEVVVGHALGTILEWCDRMHPDLLVLGAHSTLDAFRHMGYVASGAIRKATAPVLAVHASSNRAFGRILVATDFSETSLAALRHALRVAPADGCDIEIIHAFPDPWAGAEPPDWHRATVPDFAERYAKRVREQIQEWAKPILAEKPKISASFTAVQHPKPGQAIVERAKKGACDLIAIGTKGTTNLRYLLLGSTAERVLREVPCSVLAVKPD